MLQLYLLFSLSVDLVFYDLISSYFEGPGLAGLAALGYSRDHEPGKPQVVIGLLLCNGLPIGHEVFEDNRVDKKTVKEVFGHLKKRFQIQRCIFVGDRGLISTENLEALKAEQFDGGRTANLLTGSIKDEYFTRADANGTRSFFTDALGS